MKTFLVLLLTLTSVVVSACEGIESNDCVYEKHNFRFSYDHNWHVEEESGWFSSPYVFLETEDSGLIMVLLVPKEHNKSLETFATEYSKTANSQILLGIFRSESFSEITSKNKLPGIEEKLNLNIFDEDVPMTRQYFSFSSDDKIAYIIIQLDDEELDNLADLDTVLSSFEFIAK